MHVCVCKFGFAALGLQVFVYSSWFAGLRLQFISSDMYNTYLYFSWFTCLQVWVCSFEFSGLGLHVCVCRFGFAVSSLEVSVCSFGFAFTDETFRGLRLQIRILGSAPMI